VTAVRRLLALAPLAALLAGPGGAWGHAVLTHSTPHRGQSVEQAPPRVQFDFNEPVEVSFGAVRVFDEDGDRVDEGGIERPDGSATSVAVELRDGLGDGVYTGTYRVVSADGHPVSGGFSFGVGEALPTGGSAPSVADLLEETDAGPAVEGAYGVARGLHYAALLFLIGAFAFAALLRPRAGLSPRWPRRSVIAAAVIGLASAIAGIGLQGALGAGVGLDRLLDSAVLEGSLDTRAGEAWAIRAAAWLVVLILVATAPRRPQRWLVGIAGVALGVVAVSMPLAGHAETQSPAGLLVPTDLLHLLAAGLWLGGLLTVTALYWPRGDAGPDHEAAAATAAFSRVALPSMLILVAAGILQGWIYLGSLTEILSGTYAIALLSKLVLVAAIVASATRARRAVGRLAGETAAAAGLRRVMRVEIAMAVLVLAATAVLVRAAPPASVAAGPAEEELDLGPMRLEMVIEPAKTGPNDFHLYLFDRRTGAQVDRVKQMTVRLVQRDKDIGPIRLDIPRRGPAHYELLDQALGVPGTWEVQVDARVSEFDAYTAATEIEVR
jgi:copper transport protein